MTLSHRSKALALAAVLTGLIFVAPAVSSTGSLPHQTAETPAAPQIIVQQPKDVRAVVPRPAKLAEGTAAGIDCQKVRRKLWVESEGWVVRRVARCA